VKHLVTGGSGFIGNLIARRLLARGETVRILDIQSDPSRPAGIEFVNSSILNREAVAASLRDVDVVHHNAALVAQTGAGRRYWDVNVEGTRIIAEEAAKASVKSIIHISTTAVFGIPPSGAITANTPLKPCEPYGKSKLAGENLMKEVCDRNRIPLTTIRPRATLGAGRLGIFQILFEWIRENRNVYVIGSGNRRVQFVHVNDLMDFYMLALQSEQSGTYNVGAADFETLRGDLENLIAHAGSTSRIRSLNEILAVNTLRLLYHMRVSPLVPWHYLTYHRECHFDVTSLLNLGWRPKYSNAAMLCESYDWYRRNSGGEMGISPHRSPLKQGVLGLLKRLS
jgi:nucleoside-diphosphate-sugar epimerase